MATRIPAAATYAPRITHFEVASLDDLYEGSVPPNALWLAGDLDAAIAAADQMLASDPGDITGYWGRIRVLLAWHRLDDAIATFRDALDRWPHNDKLRGQYAYTLIAAGRPEEAAAAVEPMGHDDATSKATAIKATVLTRAGHVDRALELIAGAALAQPNRHLFRATVLLRARRYEETITETDRALESGGRAILGKRLLLSLYHGQAQALLYLGRLDEMDAALDAAESFGDAHTVVRERVESAIERDDLERAIAHIDALLERTPNESPLLLSRAYLEMDQCDSTTARATLQRAAVALNNVFRDAHAPHASPPLRVCSLAIGSLCAVLDWHDGDRTGAVTHANGCLETLSPILPEPGQQWDIAVERSLAHLIVGNRSGALAELQAAASDQLPLRELPGRFDLLASAPQGPPPGLTMVRGVVIDA